MAEMIPPRNYRWTGAGFEVRVYRKREIVENPWKPCPTCWGQRVLYLTLPYHWSDGIPESVPCPGCCGIGDVPSAA